MCRVEIPFCSAPISTFYRLVFIFSDKFGIGMKYRMLNLKTGWKRFGSYPDRFCISHILTRYPVFTNLVYTIFTTMCLAMAINLLNLLSECKLMSCDYILHYYVCGCELLS